MQDRQKIEHIVELQDQLNEATITNWTANGNDWDTAILVESTEAIDSTAWKWWKHMETDFVNLRIEAIDTLHFLISKSLNNHAGVSPVSPGDVAEVSKEVYNSLVSAQENPDDNSTFQSLFKILIVDVLLNTDATEYFTTLGQIFVKLGMSLDDIYQDYLSKNFLNHYRQERGYKDADAGYLKVFSNGEEDNIVFKSVVVSCADEDFESLDALKQRLFAAMDALTEEDRAA